MLSLETLYFSALISWVDEEKVKNQKPNKLPCRFNPRRYIEGTEVRESSGQWKRADKLSVYQNKKKTKTFFYNAVFCLENRKISWNVRGVVLSMETFTVGRSFNRILWSVNWVFFHLFVLVEWIAAVSLAAGAAAVGYLAYKKFISKDKCCKAMVNLHIQKDNPKVVHAFDMEDLGDKAVYCRCWRSKKVRETCTSTALGNLLIFQ